MASLVGWINGLLLLEFTYEFIASEASGTLPLENHDEPALATI